MKPISNFLICTTLACAPAFAALTFVTSPSGLGANDSTSWAQLGGDQTQILGPFTASSANGVTVTGDFSPTDDTGLVADVCPDSPSCSWGPTSIGMVAGDTDIWAFDNTSGLGTGPVTLDFSTPLIGGGAWIQGDTAGSYTASIEAFNGATFLGSFTENSDASGDPIFLGLLENPSVSDITGIVFSLTSCGGCTNLGDFAIDTLLMTDTATATPEPSSALFLGAGLAGIAWVIRNRTRLHRR